MMNALPDLADEAIDPIGGIMFDVDGTLILSDRQLGQYQLLPGASELLNELLVRGIPHLLLTNGSAYPASQQAAKLRAVGLPVADEAMFTPNSVAAHVFARRGIERVMILGQDSVHEAFAELGFEPLAADEHGAARAQAVYVGWHPECTMPHIHAACDAVLAGAAFFTASDVPFFATRSGRAYGYSCAIAGAIARVTDCVPEVTGKPSRHAMDFVAAKLSCVPARLAVVGDDPRVEIEMARMGGAIGIGVTTGTTSRAEWYAQPIERRPHRVVDGLKELARLGLFG